MSDGGEARPPALPAALFANPNYIRLWAAGGIANAMRWLEMLVAGVFTYEVTGSALIVASVTILRLLPMLLVGALAGAVAEALDRRILAVGGMIVVACVSVALCLLSAFAVLQLWHVAIAGAVAGTVAATDMSVRRRMMGDSVTTEQLARGVALDSVTASTSRMLGPLIGGIALEAVGLTGAYAISSAVHICGVLVVMGLAVPQAAQRLSFARIPSDIGEAVATARSSPILLSVIGVTVIMNIFAFSYASVIAPIGVEVYGATPAMIGFLAAAEPTGALIGGLVLAGGWFAGERGRMLMAGGLICLVTLLAAALTPWFWPALIMLLLGGLGTAAFGAMQSTVVIAETPPALRSRVLGLITMCIGTGPIGVFVIGILADRLGPARAMAAMAVGGLICLTLLALRRPRGRGAS